MKTPLAVECPACLVPAGLPCTKPTDTSRVNVTWFHFSRTALADKEAYEDSHEPT